MSARKKSGRTRKAKPAAAPKKVAALSPARIGDAAQAPGLNKVIDDLRKLEDFLYAAYEGIARDYYCQEVPMLRGGIEDLGNILIQLERVKRHLPRFVSTTALRRRVHHEHGRSDK
jgi:hypothetical protein